MRTSHLILLITAFFFFSRDLNAQNALRVYLPTPCSLAPTSVTNANRKTVDFLLYPNPGKGIINIEFSRIIDSPAKLNIINLQGVVIYSEIIQENTLNRVINVSTLQRGVYILQIQNSEVAKRQLVVLN